MLVTTWGNRLNKNNLNNTANNLVWKKSLALIKKNKVLQNAADTCVTTTLDFFF